MKQQTGKTSEVDSIVLAKHVINSVIDKGLSVSHLKLQKLIYFINAWHLAYFEQPLVADDFEAWVHEPVSRKVWCHFKDQSLLNDKLSKQEGESDFERQTTDDQRDLVEDVLTEYAGDSSYTLEKITHAEPMWIQAREGLRYDEPCNKKMDLQDVKEHYQSLID